MALSKNHLTKTSRGMGKTNSWNCQTMRVPHQRYGCCTHVRLWVSRQPLRRIALRPMGPAIHRPGLAAGPRVATKMSAEGAALGSLLSLKCRTFGLRFSWHGNRQPRPRLLPVGPLGLCFQLMRRSRDIRRSIGPPTVSGVSSSQTQGGVYPMAISSPRCLSRCCHCFTSRTRTTRRFGVFAARCLRRPSGLAVEPGNRSPGVSTLRGGGLPLPGGAAHRHPLSPECRPFSLPPALTAEPMSRL